MAETRTTTLGERLLSETKRWPRSWEGVPEDIPLGRDLVKVMLPFLRALVASGAARTTLRRHFWNAWVLGGHIVREVSIDRPAQHAAALELVLEALEEDAGPLITDFVAEEEQRSFDLTCRQLSRFLRKGRRPGPAPH